jgi:Domain of unknown function (DUF4465)
MLINHHARRQRAVLVSALLLGNWTTVSLSPLAGATSLAFSLTSTDVGPFGMNTPA